MKILADENILQVHQAFSTLGHVQTLPAAAIAAESIKDADLLLVRSVTQVSSRLLAGSRVKFVGTATIGYDHIHLDYLKQRNIGFASAPGSNANSVAEYVMSALFVLADRHGFHLQDKKVGIIGRGYVGSNLLKKLQALGVTCLKTAIFLPEGLLAEGVPAYAMASPPSLAGITFGQEAFG